jgi:hypothetical protein
MPDVPVRVRDCACPGSPHADEGDLVYLSPTLSMDGGILAEQQVQESGGDGNVLTRLWVRTFIEHGVTGWNLLDEAGEPVPFDLAVITADWSLARPVGDAAAGLYGDVVLAPFLQASASKSPTGPTRRGTSHTRRPTPASV